MEKLLILSLILNIAILANGQGVPPRPTEGQLKDLARKTDLERRMGDMRKYIRNLEGQNSDKILDANLRKTKVFRNKIAPLYRKLNEPEKKLLAPEREDLEEFAEFLSHEDTCLTKLIIDRGCDINAKVVVTTLHCLKYTMPGAGSAYSFRVKSHQRHLFSDLSFLDNKFYTPGLLTQGLHVNIGDVPLEEVSPTTPGVGFLISYEPPTELGKLIKSGRELDKGIKEGSFTYKHAINIHENATYVFRSIAYRGRYFVYLNNKVVYNALEYDERKDVIVAFRVIRYQPDESITILWKLLIEKESPLIKL